jgi:ribonucleoside-diphosphate reductase alpha chain
MTQIYERLGGELMEAKKVAVADSVTNKEKSNISHIENLDTHTDTTQAEFNAYQPGEYKVIRRNGKVTSFDPTKIVVALTKAFLNVEGGTAATSTRIHEKVNVLTHQIVRGVTRRMNGGGTVHIEDIQDYVELALMRAGEQKVAREYVIYREDRARERAEKNQLKQEYTPSDKDVINVTRIDGNVTPLDMNRLLSIINEACGSLDFVEGHLIIDDAYRNLFDGVNEKDVNHALVMSARTLIEKEPNYSYVAARLLLDNLRQEALSFIHDQPTGATQTEMTEVYPIYFGKYIQRTADLGLVDKELVKYDLGRLGMALKPERDQQFTYLGLQTLFYPYR